jgi:hypothetical protein
VNDGRYQELLGRLLDNDLGPNEADELTAWLRVNPHLLLEVRQHLYLWELFSQQQQPERTAAAVFAGWQTRLRAETDGASFTERVEAQIRNEQAAQRPPWSSWSRWLLDHKERRWIAAPALAALILLCLGISHLLRMEHQPQLVFNSNQAIRLERHGRELALFKNEPLKDDDVLRVPEQSEALIAYSREVTRLRVFGPAAVKILDWRRGKHFELSLGRVEASVAHQPAGEPMVWRTPQAEATVVGTELVLEAITNATQLDVIQGAVRLRSLDLGQLMVMTNGQTATVEPGNPFRVNESAIGRGRILREYWLNVAGIHVGDLTHDPRFPNQPSGQEYLTTISITPDSGRNYGARMRGYIYPPRTGRYTFWITASESAQLWLSTDESPGNAQMVASLSQAVPPGRWDVVPWQKSSAVRLMAGRKYYIEVLHKASDQKDHCTVAWQDPGHPRQIISGEYISPFTEPLNRNNSTAR